MAVSGYLKYIDLPVGKSLCKEPVVEFPEVSGSECATLPDGRPSGLM